MPMSRSATEVHLAIQKRMLFASAVMIWATIFLLVPVLWIEALTDIEMPPGFAQAQSVGEAIFRTVLYVAFGSAVSITAKRLPGAFRRRLLGDAGVAPSPPDAAG